MSSKNIVFLLNAHHPYIKHSGIECEKYLPEMSLLFEDISNVYIPLLDMFGRLEKDGINFKIAMSFSAPLCTLLCDEEIKAQYTKYLNNLIEFGKKEVLRKGKNRAQQKNAELYLEKVKQTKRSWTEVYGQKLLKHFALFEKKGYIEILATSGSYAFLPHYVQDTEVLNAQIESGLYAVRHFFGTSAEGFVLPEMGFAPGIEEVLRQYGVGYTVLPSMSFLFSQSEIKGGIFLPVRTSTSLRLFAAEQIDISQFSLSSVYKNQQKDLGWDLDAKYLTPFICEGGARRRTSWCYWNNLTLENEDAIKNNVSLYNALSASEQAQKDAEYFFNIKKELLNKAALLLPNEDTSYSFVFDVPLLHRKWDESILWLESLIRCAAKSDAQITTYSELLVDKFNLQKIKPYPASFSRTLYGEDLLSNRNDYMTRYIKKCSDRMVDLACRFPNDTGLKARLLNLASRELMIAQGLEWATMVEYGEYSDYASTVFKECICAFTGVFDALGSNTVNTEWLCNMEKKHQIFPWINYRIFSKKH